MSFYENDISFEYMELSFIIVNRMPESRTITKRSSQFTKKAIEHDVVEKKENTKYPVGPWAMAFFAFVIVGSTLFQFISMWYSS